MSTKIIVIGSKGRMGQRISALIQADANLELKAGVDQGDKLEKVIEGADAIIDFSSRESTVHNVQIAAEHAVPIVIGTTGLNEAEEALITAASKKVAIIHAPNMSVGVNVLFNLVEKAARAFGMNMRIDLEETHHIHKKDSPSGTAVRVLEHALKGSGFKSNEVAYLEGQEANIPQDKPVSCRALREGEVIGDHAVTFSNEEETLTISHHAKTRDIFAAGSITAAKWIVGKAPGKYSMNDVLGLGL